MIAPDQSAEITRQYRASTLILETTFSTPEGRVLLIDFMPPKGKASDLIRIAIGIEGQVRMRSELVIRFDYGHAVPWVSRLDNGTLRGIAGPQMLLLKTPIPLRGEHMATIGEFTISAGDKVPFVLTHAPSHLPPPESPDPFEALASTEKFWVSWSTKCRQAGKWSNDVLRSVITLKALTFATDRWHCRGSDNVSSGKDRWRAQLGLPLCWARDATLTLLSLMGAGYFEEASAWREWLVRAIAGDPDQLQIMYGVAGERRLAEWEVAWLNGYEQSKPVRVGNAAHSQLQLDVFGEIMDALYQARCGGLPGSGACLGHGVRSAGPFGVDLDGA